MVSRETSANYSLLAVWVVTALSRETNDLSHLSGCCHAVSFVFCRFFPDSSAVSSHLLGVPARLSLEKSNKSEKVHKNGFLKHVYNIELYM